MVKAVSLAIARDGASGGVVHTVIVITFKFLRMVHVIVILLDIFLIGVIVFDTYILEVCSLVNVWILDFNTYILVKVIRE